jgi:nitroreductase
MTAEDIERFSARIAEVRGQTAADVEPYKKMMMEVVKRPAPVAQEWIARQVYIALGVFLTAAATLGIDACPMEGIDPAQYDTILGLKAKGYRTIVVATAGYRAADDKYASAAKVRFPTADVVRHL